MLAQVISELGQTIPGSARSVKNATGVKQDFLHMLALSLTRRISGLTNKRTLAQHLTTDHPDQRKNVDAFSFKVVTAGERPLTRQLREAQKIANDIPSGQLINGRSEHIPPAFRQMAPVDMLDRERNRVTGR